MDEVSSVTRYLEVGLIDKVEIGELITLVSSFYLRMGALFKLDISLLSVTFA